MHNKVYSGLLELAALASESYSSSYLRLQWFHIGSLKSPRVRVFTPWKWTNTTNEGFSPRESVYQCTAAYTLTNTSYDLLNVYYKLYINIIFHIFP